MHSAALLLALAASGLAAQQQERSTGFTISIHNTRTRQHHPSAAVRRAWARDQVISARLRHADGLTDPEGLAQVRRDLEWIERQALTARGLGRRQEDVDVVNYGHDYAWAIPISIGTPRQEFDMSIDTGSSDTWVRTACDSQDCVGAPTYKPAASTTFTNATASTAFVATYGGGRVVGYKGADQIQIGDQWVTSGFGIATSATNLFTAGSSMAGLMGLGWPGGRSNPDLDLLWRRFLPAGDQNAMFSLYLSRDTKTEIGWSLDKKVADGALTLGGMDSTYYQGDINYLPIVQPKTSQGTVVNYWLIELDGMSMDGKAIDTNVGGSKSKVLMDSGTTMVGGPSAAIEAIYANIAGATLQGDNWLFPCDSFNTTNHALSFTFGGVSYPMQKWDIVATTEDAGMCRGTFYVLTNENRYDWIFGGGILKNVYTVYRTQPPSIGVAKLADQYNKPLYGGSAAATSSAPSTTATGGRNSTSSAVSANATVSASASASASASPSASAATSSTINLVPTPNQPNGGGTGEPLAPTTTGAAPFNPTITQTGGRTNSGSAATPRAGTGATALLALGASALLAVVVL